MSGGQQCAAGIIRRQGPAPAYYRQGAAPHETHCQRSQGMPFATTPAPPLSPSPPLPLTPPPPPPQCHTASHPTTHSLVNSHTASLHVMQSLDRLPPVEAFRFLVQESGYALTTHILHGTFCQCSISACWHQERHCHACGCRPWHSQRMRP